MQHESVGWARWETVRQRLGGRVSTESFRSTVESLLTEGLLVECWTSPTREWLTARHLLVMPGNAFSLPSHPVRVKGRRSVIDETLGVMAEPLS